MDTNKKDCKIEQFVIWTLLVLIILMLGVIIWINGPGFGNLGRNSAASVALSDQETNILPVNATSTATNEVGNNKISPVDALVNGKAPLLSEAKVSKPVVLVPKELSISKFLVSDESIEYGNTVIFKYAAENANTSTVYKMLFQCPRNVKVFNSNVDGDQCQTNIVEAITLDGSGEYKANFYNYSSRPQPVVVSLLAYSKTKDGQTYLKDSSVRTVYVETDPGFSPAPTHNFDFDLIKDVQSGGSPLTVNFTSRITDLDRCVSVVWNFGDGSGTEPTTVCPDGFSVKEVTQSHTYTKAGGYGSVLSVDGMNVYAYTAVTEPVRR
ncbi:MAG: hypothetical protein WC797_02905 [Candidatus Paceibacterota bacterium]|jgi:hypothetical protein